jgi:uncharacterized tellurite resistance protein B-like protein
LDIAAFQALRAQFKISNKLTADIQAAGQMPLTKHRDALLADTSASQAIIAAMGYTGSDAAQIATAVGNALLYEVVFEAAEDENISENEEAEILRLADLYGLSDEECDAVCAAVATPIYQRALSEAVGDLRLSPAEEERLERLRVGLKISAGRFSEADKKLMEDARKLWKIESGPLEPVSSPLNLKRGEEAYWVGRGQAIEIRQRTVSTSYRGPRFRVPIVRGVSYTLGTSRVSRKVEAYQHVIGKGDVVLTNKRFLLRHGSGALQIPHGSIVDIEPFRDGANIVKSSGKPVTVQLDGDDLSFCALLQRLVAEAGS